MIFINVIVTEHFKEHAGEVGIRVISLTMFTEAQIPHWYATWFSDQVGLRQVFIPVFFSVIILSFGHGLDMFTRAKPLENMMV